MTSKTINAAQGAAALIGITLGAIPMVQYLLRGTAGSVWKLLGTGTGTAAWAGPLAVVLAALVAITVLERGRTRG